MKIIVNVASQPRRRRNFGHALRDAIRGVAAAAVTERSFRIELFVFVIVIALGLWLDITSLEWVAVLLVSVAVLVTELLNSSLEAVADAVHPEYSEYIRRAKDMSAAAVLLVSVVSLGIGITIFAPPLLKLLGA